MIYGFLLGVLVTLLIFEIAFLKEEKRKEESWKKVEDCIIELWGDKNE